MMGDAPHLPDDGLTDDGLTDDGLLDDVTAAATALGGDTFEARVMALLNRVLPVDHCAVFTFDPEGRAGHLFTSTRMAEADADRLARDYVAGRYAEDPNFETVRQTRRDDAPAFEALAPADFDHRYSRDYRNRFFDRVDLVDKASALTRLTEGVVYCNFYRMGASGRFSDRDRARLNRIMPLVTSLIAAHYRLLRPGPVQAGPGKPARKPAVSQGRAQSLVHSVIGRATPPFDRLTGRERDVCARILLGYTAEAIGLDLQIAPTSVATYRKRAYAKLGIATQNELFGICLEATGTTG